MTRVEDVIVTMLASPSARTPKGISRQTIACDLSRREGVSIASFLAPCPSLFPNSFLFFASACHLNTSAATESEGGVLSANSLALRVARIVHN